MKSDKASQDIHSISQVSRLLFILKAPMKTNTNKWEEFVTTKFATNHDNNKYKNINHVK